MKGTNGKRLGTQDEGALIALLALRVDSTALNLQLFTSFSTKKLLARKVGITNTNARIDRLREFKKLGWEVLVTFESDPGLKVQTSEQLFFQWLRKDAGLPPFLAAEDLGVLGGWSETFSLEGLSNKSVIKKLEGLLGMKATKSGSSKEK